MTPSIGTTLKINVNLELEGGITMDDISFNCDFYVGSKHVYVDKYEMVRIDENNYVAVLDSNKLSVGEVWVLVKADIEDTSCPDGIRHEYVRASCNVTIDR